MRSKYKMNKLIRPEPTIPKRNFSNELNVFPVIIYNNKPVIDIIGIVV